LRPPATSGSRRRTRPSSSTVELPTGLLPLLWQATVVEIEPGSRYGSRTDAAAVNSTLSIRNDTSEPLRFPLILATTDAEDRTPRGGSRSSSARPADEDADWQTLAAAIRTNAAGRGIAGDRVEHYLTRLRASVRRAYRSELVTLGTGEERFVRTYQRKLIPGWDGEFELRALCPLPQFALSPRGAVSVVVVLPAAALQFGVEVVDWHRPSSTRVSLGDRLAISWEWQEAAADVFVAYRYEERDAAV
jgi:hypothetical protein